MRPSSAGAKSCANSPASPLRPASATFSFERVRPSIFETHIDSEAYLEAKERRSSIAQKSANIKRSFTHVDFRPVCDLASAAKAREDKARQRTARLGEEPPWSRGDKNRSFIRGGERSILMNQYATKIQKIVRVFLAKRRVNRIRRMMKTELKQNVPWARAVVRWWG